MNEILFTKLDNIYNALNQKDIDLLNTLLLDIENEFQALISEDQIIILIELKKILIEEYETIPTSVTPFSTLIQSILIPASEYVNFIATIINIRATTSEPDDQARLAKQLGMLRNISFMNIPYGLKAVHTGTFVSTVLEQSFLYYELYKDDLILLDFE